MPAFKLKPLSAAVLVFGIPSTVFALGGTTPPPNNSPLLSSCEAAVLLDRTQQFNCLKEVERLWTDDFLPSATGSIYMPDVLTADPSAYGSSDIMNDTNVFLGDVGGNLPVYEENALSLSLVFTVEADPNQSHQVIVAVSEDQVPAYYPLITNVFGVRTIPAGTGDYYIEVDISEPREPGRRLIRYALIIDGIPVLARAAVVKHQPTGFGVLELPVMPVTLVYAPDQNGATSNTVQYATTHTWRSTLTTRFARETANTSGQQTDFHTATMLRNWATQTAGRFTQIGTPGAKDVAKGLNLFAKILGSASATQTDVDSTVDGGSLTVSTSNTRVSVPNNPDGLGAGDYIYFLINARFAWVADDGDVRITLLSHEADGHATMGAVRSDFDVLNAGGNCTGGNTTLGALTNRTCDELSALLSMDPFSQTDHTTLDPDRFEKRTSIEIAAGTATQCNAYTRTLDNTTTDATVESTITVKKHGKGLLAVLGLGVTNNLNLRSTTTHSYTQSITNSETVSASYCFGSDPLSPITYQLTFDKAFGSFILSRQPIHTILGYCTPEDPDPRPTRWIVGPALHAVGQPGGRALLATYDRDDTVIVNQQNPDGSWVGWSNLGGGPRRHLAVAQHADGRAIIFSRAACGPLWTNAQAAPNSATWRGWRMEDEAHVANFAAARDAVGRVIVYGLGDDGILRMKEETAANAGGFGDWKAVATPNDLEQSAPALGHFPTGDLAIFIKTTAGVLLHKRLASGTDVHFPSNWLSLGGGLGRGPAGVTASANGRLHVFAIGQGRGMLLKTQRSSAQGSFDNAWRDLGGNFLSYVPRAAADTTGRIAIFGPKFGDLGYARQAAANSTSYGAWTSTGPAVAFISTPTLITLPDGRLRIFAKNTSGVVHTKTENPSNLLDPFSDPWVSIP